MQVGADILLVIGTIVGIFSVSSIIGGWVVRRWPVAAMVSFAIAVALFAYVHTETEGGLNVHDVPNAFISVAARILN